jgi:uncharacterized damage-inducible protein DinB
MQSRESDRDSVAVLGQLVPTLVRAIEGLNDRGLREREGPGKWSILEVIQHLADTELVYGWRVRQILTSETPVIQAYDQDAWATQLRYNEASLDGAVDQLRALRRANIQLYRSLTDEQRQRCGIHSERGRESVGDIMVGLVRHDFQHMRQIERIKKAVMA